MRKLILAFAFIVLAWPARGATDVWLMYGWGPNGWSSGIDEIARKARTLSGVNHVTTLDYMETQRAYDEILASPPEHSIVIGGYSCGGNGALAVSSALEHNHRQAHVIMLQPSEWCGQYQTTPKVRYAQDTWSPDTFGLGSYQPQGGAFRTVLIERATPHGAADTDPLYQRDMLFAIAAVADPSRRHWLANHLGRTTHFVWSNGRIIRLMGN